MFFMVQGSVFQLIIGVTGFAFLLLFISVVDEDDPKSLEQKMVGLIFLYTVSMFTLLIPATTRQTYSIGGFQIPPLQVWMEAIILGFMFSIGRDILSR